MKAWLTTAGVLGRARRALAAGGWPLWGGIGSIAAGLLLLDSRSRLEVAATELLAAPLTSRATRSGQTSAEGAPMAPVAPPYSMHLDDVREMVRLARSHDMRVEAVDYQTEAIAALSLLQRGVELRLVGNYPEFKSLLSAILQAVPHASIRDVRIEGGDGSPALKATVKLSMLYQAGPQAENSPFPRNTLSGPSFTAVRTGASDAVNPFGKLGGSASDNKVQQAIAPVAPKPVPKPVVVAAAPVQPPPGPSAPTAPPLPFVAIGSIQGTDVTGGKQVAFIRQQDQLLVVRAGEAIGQVYRVESVTPQGIEFTYLPLKQRQTLVLAP